MYHMVSVDPRQAEESHIESLVRDLRSQGWSFVNVGPSRKKIELFFKRPAAESDADVPCEPRYADYSKPSLRTTLKRLSSALFR
jgi:hypothetical protein